MADLSAVTTIAPVSIYKQRVGPAAEAITAGQHVRMNVLTGTVELGNSSSAAEARWGGMALSDAITNEGVNVVTEGILDVGNILSALAYDADIYIGSTDGLLANAAAGSSGSPIGRVVAGFGTTTADKLLEVWG